MNRTTSVYLDAARLTAAVAVFLGHFSYMSFSGGMLWQTLGLASPAVDVFFVLSGFVIAYAASRPGMTGLGYGLDRASRVLSVSVPALAVTLVVACFSQGGLTDTRGSGYPVWQQLLAGVVFLNESWFGHIRIPLDSPYWSLCYEVWYYAVFGALAFGTGVRRWVWAAVLLLIAGPMVAMLFPLWLLGVATYRICLRRAVGPWAGLALFAASFGGGLGYVAWAWTHGGVPVLPAIYARGIHEVWPDYLVGAVFALSILGVHAAAPLLDRAVRPFAKPAAAAASVTFTLYLLHVPVMTACRAISPWAAGSIENRVFIIGTMAAVVIAVAWVTEHRRKRLRYWLAGLLFRVSGGALRSS